MPENKRTAVAVGTFDGVHRGHLEVLKELESTARSRGLPTMVVTFDPHPSHVLRPENKLKLLTGLRKKISIFNGLSLDYLAVLNFDRTISNITPERFVSEYLIGRYRMQALVAGYDHAFGRRRSGEEEVLARLSKERNFTLIKVAPVIIDGRPVSSSWIREAVDQGDLQLASKLLGRFYSFSALVERGSGRGKKLGYPTANLKTLSPEKQLFPEGVYASLFHLHGKSFPGVLHYGPRPTFNETFPTMEINLFDFNDDLYNLRIEVSVIERIRPVMCFKNAEELTNQIDRDNREARKVLDRVKVSNTFLSRAV